MLHILYALKIVIFIINDYFKRHLVYTNYVFDLQQKNGGWEKSLK